jgi:hypothetical protein
MQVYTKCVSGRQEANKQRIFDATRIIKAALTAEGRDR